MNLGGASGHPPKTAFASVLSLTYTVSDLRFQRLLERLGALVIRRAVILLFVVAGLLLSMNTATMDASRALYGISREGLTLKWFGRLNDQHMPANAIIADAAVNVALLVLFDNTLAILVASNLGYVLAHILALTGVLLLRRDRPDAVRPVKLASYWLPVAAILAALNVVFLVVGNLNLSKIGYAGTDKLAGISVEFWYGLLILLMSLVLWGYRRKVEDARSGPVHQH